MIRAAKDQSFLFVQLPEQGGEPIAKECVITEVDERNITAVVVSSPLKTFTFDARTGADKLGSGAFIVPMPVEAMDPEISRASGYLSLSIEGEHLVRVVPPSEGVSGFAQLAKVVDCSFEKNEIEVEVLADIPRKGKFSLNERTSIDDGESLLVPLPLLQHMDLCKGTTVRIHHFKSTQEAYDQSQCSDDIKSGDVLVAGFTVAILDRAWPVAVKGDPGCFHELVEGVTFETFEGGKYKDSLRVAQAYDNSVATVKVYDDKEQYTKEQAETTYAELKEFFNDRAENNHYGYMDDDATQAVNRKKMQRMFVLRELLNKPFKDLEPEPTIKSSPNL